MMWLRASVVLLAAACGGVTSSDFDASTGDAGTADAPSASDARSPDAAGVDAMPRDRLVFVTSQAFSGNFGGLVGADGLCQAAAIDADLPGSYMAWLSDSTGSPSSRMRQSPGPYRLTNGEMVAASWTDLTDGTILAPIDRDERGNLSSGVFVCQGGEVWTNTTAAGAVWAATDCSDWTSIRGTSAAGNVGFADSSWTESGCVSITCQSGLPLYCVEQ